MKLFKVLLSCFIITFCLSAFVVVAAKEVVGLVGIYLPARSGIYTTLDINPINKTDSTNQTLETIYSAHNIEGRVALCLTPTSTSCVGENNWVTVLNGQTKTLANSNQPGYFRLQLKTVNVQLFSKTEYQGYWYWKQ